MKDDHEFFLVVLVFLFASLMFALGLAIGTQRSERDTSRNLSSGQAVRLVEDHQEGCENLGTVLSSNHHLAGVPWLDATALIKALAVDKGGDRLLIARKNDDGPRKHPIVGVVYRCNKKE